MLNCLGVDQSLTATGVCLLQFDPLTEKSKISKIETIITKEKGVKRLIVIRDKLRDYYQPSVVVITRENYAFTVQSRSTYSTGELGGIIAVDIFEKGFKPGENFFIVHNTTWKKFFLGQGNVKKDTEYLMKMYKAFKIEFRSDGESDSYCLSLIGAYIYSIKKGLMKFSNLNDIQQTCLLDVKKLKEAELTQPKAIKQLNDDDKLKYMIDF